MARTNKTSATSTYDVVVVSSVANNDNGKPILAQEVDRIVDWCGDTMRSCSSAVGAVELQSELDSLRRIYLELYVLRVSRKNDRVTERQMDMLRRASEYMVEANGRLARYRGVTIDA